MWTCVFNSNSIRSVVQYSTTLFQIVLKTNNTGAIMTAYRKPILAGSVENFSISPTPCFRIFVLSFDSYRKRHHQQFLTYWHICLYCCRFESTSQNVCEMVNSCVWMVKLEPKLLTKIWKIVFCFYFNIKKHIFIWNIYHWINQWKNSDEEKVHLEKIDFDAAGRYYCEVSTDTPIFTKESNVEQVHVIGKINKIRCECHRPLFHPPNVIILLPWSVLIGFSVCIVTVQQTGPPKITFSKRQFTIGENLVSNCTTSKAHPAPHITWLINGKQVRNSFHSSRSSVRLTREYGTFRPEFIQTINY